MYWSFMMMMMIIMVMVMMMVVVMVVMVVVVVMVVMVVFGGQGAVIDVVAVQADEENDDGRNCSPEDFQRQIAFHGNAIPQLSRTTPEANQTEHQKSDDPDKQDRSNRE